MDKLKSTPSLGDLFRRPPDAAGKAGLGSYLEASMAWPELSVTSDLFAPSTSKKIPVPAHSNFVQLMALITGEDQNKISEAMTDESNVAGRVLASIEQRLREELSQAKGRVGRPPKANKFASFLLSLLVKDRSEDARWSQVAQCTGKLGQSKSAEQVKEHARKFRKSIRTS